MLIVALAIVGLALLAPAVSAHGNDVTPQEAPPYDGTGADWAAWMEAQMNEHMGSGSVEWMESHMGLTVEDMGQDMAAGNDGSYGMYGMRDGC